MQKHRKYLKLKYLVLKDTFVAFSMDVQHTLIDTNTVMDLRKPVIDDIMPLTSPGLTK